MTTRLLPLLVLSLALLAPTLHSSQAAAVDPLCGSGANGHSVHATCHQSENKPVTPSPHRSGSTVEGPTGPVRVWLPCSARDLGCQIFEEGCRRNVLNGATDETGRAEEEFIDDGRILTPTYGMRCQTVGRAAGRQPDWAQLAYGELVRQAPAPPVKTSGPPVAEPTTLVNLQTILWADTAVDRPLATATLAGQRVALRTHLEKVAWDFGDGETAATTEPGHPYDPQWHKCDTKMCPDYYGHVYKEPGHVTVRATVTWSGQFQVNGGTWIDIPGTATGATTELPIWVREAHAILVPNPGD